MGNYSVNYRIHKRMEGTYFTIPFSVPDGLERVKISYEYAGGIVDIGLMDNNEQFLGWSGSARKAIHVGPYSATPGYKITELTPGRWQILVGAYKIPQEGVEVRYTIEYFPREQRWFTGDLHVHSTASDGQYDIFTLAKRARKKGLDFLAVANHNNYNENFNLPAVPGLTLIPAVEWTHYKGHMNFYGVAAPFGNFIANSEDEMQELVESVKAKGAVVSVCHPKDKNCGFVWGSDEIKGSRLRPPPRLSLQQKEISDEIFDMVEVWNGPMRPTNVKNIKWWHSLLLEDKKIPLIGGSDYHKSFSPVLLGHPVTRVFANSPGAKDILDAISRGNSYVTATAGGPELSLTADHAIMGDTVDWYEGMEIEINTNKLGFGIKAKLVTALGTINLHGGQEYILVHPAWKFAYLVLSRSFFVFQQIIAISNPIYFNLPEEII